MPDLSPQTHTNTPKLETHGRSFCTAPRPLSPQMERLRAQVERDSRRVAARERRGRAPRGTRLCSLPRPRPHCSPRSGAGEGHTWRSPPGGTWRFSRCAAWNPHTHLPGEKSAAASRELRGFFSTRDNSGGARRDAVHPPALASSRRLRALLPGLSLTSRRCLPETQPPAEEPAGEREHLPQSQEKGSPRTTTSCSPCPAHFLDRTLKSPRGNQPGFACQWRRSAEECFQAESLNSTEMTERDRHKRNSNLFQDF
ncbi:hypothetical protein AAY473_018751 [Plecturocebus cupreus]